jgi:NAD(P)-dependent dehydrogenase (short-subunit alcohol dehydrogenase family)
MKNILLVGASSDSARSLIKRYEEKYNFIRLSRNSVESEVDDFNIHDSNTYYSSDIKYDGLVYFPGTINLRPFKNLKITDFYNDFDINVMGLVKILKFYIPYFNDGCSMIFLSSLAGKMGLPFHSSISISKSALVGLSKSLAAEFAPKFRVNCISPSLFKSKMSERLLKNEISQERIKNNNPLKRIGSSDDISSLLNFLLSDDSQWITGQDISIDGGMSSLKI